MAQTKTEADAIFDAADEAALKYRAVKALENIDRTLWSIAVSVAAFTITYTMFNSPLRRVK